MKRHFKNYVWFIKTSQDYMAGYNRIIVFAQSLYKGFVFCYEMNKTKSEC